MLENHYSIAFHGIIGIVMAATITVLPFQSFAASISDCAINLLCLVSGVLSALVLDRFNSKVEMTVYSKQ